MTSHPIPIGKAARRLALLCAAVFVATACSGSATLAPTTTVATPNPSATQPPVEKVTFRLDWVPTGTSAYAYLAVAKGFFTEQGLDVTVEPGQGSKPSIDLVANGSDTFGSAEGGVVVQAVTQGEKVKMVSSTYPAGGNGILALKSSGITKPQDLVGKTVGIPTASSAFQLWPAFLAANNIDPNSVKVVNLASSALVTQLVAKTVDAVGIYPFSSGAPLDAAGTPTSSFLYSDSGVNTLGLGVIASLSTIQAKPDVVRRFVAAIVKAIAYGGAHPDEAAAALVSLNPDLKLDQAVAQQVWIRFFAARDTANTKGHPIGWMAAADWTQTEDLLNKYAALNSNMTIDNFYTNDFLPAQ